MKKLFSLLLLVAPLLANTQSVGISHDNSLPHQSAILDIQSTTKGMLPPRMSTLQRTSIMGPSIGLTVFDMDTYSYWMYRGDVMGGWIEMQHGLQNHWTANGINIYNDNAGNVGIGTNNPLEKLSINGANPVIQMLNSGTARGFFQVNGTDLKMATYFNNTTGNLILGTRATDRLWITPAGHIGIGTATPATALTISSTDPTLQLQNAEVDKGFIQLSGNDIRIGTNSTNTTGRFLVRTNGVDRLNVNDEGWVGINTTIQNSTLQVNGTGSNAAFRVQVNGSTKMLVAPNGGVTIGTNQITPPANGLYVDGMVGIGTNAPTAEITVNNLVANQFPRIEVNHNNVKMGQIEVIQNAKVDFRVGATTEEGRTIIGAQQNYWGLVVHPHTGETSIGGPDHAHGYELSVPGWIMCEDLTIDNVGDWPDYVFEKDYKLLPLADVRKFIETNKHLPNVPSAAEMDKNGLRMKEMTHTFMEKIEELTLYILQLQQQIDELKRK